MQRSRLVVLLMSTVLVWAAGASAAQAGVWTAGPTFAQGTLSGGGGAATDGTGVSTVTWAQDSGDGSTVYAQRISPDGTRGPELRVGKGNGSTVAATASGAVVAWTQATGTHDVRVARIGAGATVDAPVTVASGGSLDMPPVVAARPNGDLVVAWITPDDLDENGTDDDDVGQLHVRRIAADETKGDVVDLGLAIHGISFTDVAAVAITADGRARVAWTAVDAARTTSDVKVARLTPAGARDAVSTVSSAQYGLTPALAVSGDGAVVTWWDTDEVDYSFLRLQAARLPATGVVARAPTTIGSGIASAGRPSASVALAPDGTATIAYPRLLSATAPVNGSVFLRRLAPDGARSPETLLSAAPTAKVVAGQPSLAPGSGGQLVAVWSQLDSTQPDNGAFQVFGRTIAADGTPVADTTAIPGGDVAFMVPPVASGDGAGNGIALWLGARGANAVGYQTALFDATAPAVTAAIPETVVRGVEASFSVTATARAGISGVTWQFGDGGSSLGTAVTHTFGRTGSYPVTVTVTDFSGNETVVARTVTVTDPVVVPPPGGGTTPPGGGTVPPGGGTIPPIPPVSARLKVTKVTRTASKVTVAGTVDKRASGRVTLTWSQKVGRKTVKTSASAKIVKGRFAGTVTLTKALAKSRTAGKLTAAYAGDAHTLKASVTTSVKAPKKTKK
jgi:hypothetical protein